ncbi:hypothetical protein [Paenibacillus methanolicus]|uniref:Uncharacterized protein n=1 Tax=Paenibacillus methanolicus TaxID=582686 RepID=A0A5S5C228_9BACL|nr:hypothetical protein [Paenibacillus methanolicus]TYP72023.1 hypothetical protein BCM02_109302 [Paenibacillus methanolicus]
MRLKSRPQTELRQVSKIFRLLYPLEDRLNDYIQAYTSSNSFGTVQVFFYTDLTDDNKVVNFLSFKDNILQVETSLNWNVFSKLERIEKEIHFINQLKTVAIEVAKKYGLDISGIECAFKKLLN